MRAACLIALLACVGAPSFPLPALSIQVIRGAGANNRAARPGESIQVRVTDEAGKAEEGVIVICSAPDDGPSVEFGGIGHTAQAESDERGVATCASGRPSGGNGPVEIGILAEKLGRTANATVYQMNLGFGETSVADLNVEKLPEGTAPPGKRLVRVRVTDGSGQAVVGATVLLFLPAHKPGAPESIDAQSGPDGAVGFVLDAKSLRKFSGVMVRATATRVTATRLIPLE